MKPKEFIEVVLLSELKDVVETKPYISFAAIAIGYEFLGKALDNSNIYWHRSGNPKNDWERPFKTLDCLSKYRPFLESHKLWNSIRNGYSHSFVPKHPVNVSSKNDTYKHLEISERGRVNIKCEEFYEDLRLACLEIIKMDFPENDKMNKDFLSFHNL